ncbi:MAG TPA: archease [Kofleriaceae bacterium]|jgi:SHS2 domain-containing protein|nr:archease [Kofleriaceae bacterium]
MASHAFEQHTGEVKVRLAAKNLGELFTEAARALSDLLGVGTEEPPSPWERITLTARDHEALLVGWLNELVARAEIDGRLVRDAMIHDLTSTRLDASIRGVPFRETRTAVKAATFHGLRITPDPHGVSATVILDV